MRKLAWIIGVVLLLVVVAFAARVGRRMWASRVGPDVPVCSESALARKHFEPPLLVSGEFEGTQTEVTAAVLPSGAVAAGYIAMKSMFQDTHLGVSVISPDGKVVSRPFKTGKKRHYDPWMTVDRSGLLHFVWLGHDSGMPEKAMEIGYATSRDAETWTEPTHVQEPADSPEGERGTLDKPIVAAFGDEALVFYWSTPASSLKMRRVRPAGAQGAGVNITPAVVVDVHVDASSAIHLVHLESDEQMKDRYGDAHMWVTYLRSDDGAQTFSEGVRVSAPDDKVPVLFSSPRVLSDSARGLLYVVYPSGGTDLRWKIVLATSKDRGATWTRVQVNDDRPCANHAMPAAALDASGRVHVIWMENRSGRGGIAYASCEPGGGRCSPNEAVSEPFASYRLGRHGADWLGDYITLVADDERRRLHAVWAQPVDVDGEPRSRIFYARASLEP